MLLTLTKLRNNIFNIADKVAETNKPVFVGKNGKMDMVILSFEQYKDLEKKGDKKEKNKENKKLKGWDSFAGAGKDSYLAKLTNDEFKNEIDKIKYEHIVEKHAPYLKK